MSTIPHAGASVGAPRLRRGPLGWVLAVPNGLLAVASTLYFLLELKLGFVAWLMINSCAPSAGLFVIGFLARSRLIMVASSVLLLRYGVNGLIAYGWEPHLITSQIAHTLMTLAGVYVLVTTVRAKSWRDLAIGFALGIAILIAYTIPQQLWMRANRDLLERYLSGELMQRGGP